MCKALCSMILTIASYLICCYYCLYVSDEESEKLGLWALGSLLRDKDLGGSVRP